MITQSEYRRLKTRLSRLENKLRRVDGYPGAPNYCVPVDEEGDPRVPIYKAIIQEVREAFAIFNRDGYPDSWARWQRAADDASWQLGRFYPEFAGEFDSDPWA